jgi:hypothetical protein
MNRHLAIKMSCFCVLELRNSPAHALMPTLGRLESGHFNHNLFDPDLIRGTLACASAVNMVYLVTNQHYFYGEYSLLIYQASATGRCSRAYMDVFTRPYKSTTLYPQHQAR